MSDTITPGDVFSGKDYIAADLAKIINGVAEWRPTIMRKTRLARMADEMGMIVERCVSIAACLGVEQEMHEGLSLTARRNFFPHLIKEALPHERKYPWHLLAKDGDSFFYNCQDTGEDVKAVRASIAFGAHKRFGPGVVSTRITRIGVLVERKTA